MTSPLCIVVPSDVSTQLFWSLPRGTASTWTAGVAKPTPHTPLMSQSWTLKISCWKIALSSSTVDNSISCMHLCSILGHYTCTQSCILQVVTNSAQTTPTFSISILKFPGALQCIHVHEDTHGHRLESKLAATSSTTGSLESY